MSSQRSRSFPARFHLMMGPMSGSALAWLPSPRGSARLALLTSRHRSYRLDWGLTVPPTLPAWEPGEGVRVPMLPARSVLEHDVVSVDNLNPSRWLSYWVLIPMQPAHGAVVRPDRDLLAVQKAFKVLEGPNYCQQLLAGRAVPLFASLQRLADIGNDPFLFVLDLGQHRSLSDVARVGVEVPQSVLSRKSQYRRTDQGVLQLAESLVPPVCPFEISPLGR